MSSIVLPASFNASKLTISQPKVLESGGKMAYLNYGDARNLLFQTPSLPSPFGLNVFDKAGPPKYSIDLAMRGYQENPKVKAFYKALSDLDEFMVDQGVKNSKLWFKADMKREVVSAFYTPCVKFGRDKEGNQTPYPPNFKVQLRRTRDGNEFECQFYDYKSKSDPNAKPLKDVPIEEMLVKKVEATALVQCTGVWFAGGKFGVSWKAVQMRLDSVPEGIHGYGFQDDEEFSSRPANAKASAAAAVEDADEDEDAVEAPAPAPAPAPAADDDAAEASDEEIAPPPVPKKTVITKKKVVAAVKK